VSVWLPTPVSKLALQGALLCATEVTAEREQMEELTTGLSTNSYHAWDSQLCEGCSDIILLKAVLCAAPNSQHCVNS